LISNLQSIDKLEIFLFPFLVFVELNMWKWNKCCWFCFVLCRRGWGTEAEAESSGWKEETNIE
jgi:hypothetical protein